MQEKWVGSTRALASEIDDEGVFIAVVAGDADGGGAGAHSGGLEGDGECGRGPRCHFAKIGLSDREFATMTSLFAEGNAGELGCAGVSDGECPADPCAGSFCSAEADL